MLAGSPYLPCKRHTPTEIQLEGIGFGDWNIIRESRTYGRLGTIEEKKPLTRTHTKSPLGSRLSDSAAASRVRKENEVFVAGRRETMKRVACLRISSEHRISNIYSDDAKQAEGFTMDGEKLSV